MMVWCDVGCFEVSGEWFVYFVGVDLVVCDLYGVVVVFFGCVDLGDYVGC